MNTHAVVHLGLELDPGLDDVDGGEGTVGDGATEGTGEGETASQRVGLRECSWCGRSNRRLLLFNPQTSPSDVYSVPFHKHHYYCNTK